MIRTVTKPQADRLAAIAAGQVVPAEIHPEVAAAAAILDIQNFNLWYGSKQVLLDVNLPVAKGKVTALI